MHPSFAPAIALPALVVLSLVLPAEAQKGKRTGPPSELLTAVARCADIREDGARLACYDKAAGALVAAESRHEVVVVDQAQVRETKRRLFGIALPISPLFENAPDIDRVETTLQSATITPGAPMTFVLADGATWMQTDDNQVVGKPKQGEKVVITRGTLGSFKLALGNRPAIKVRRVN
ncbi:MAG: hypothetical protein QM688_14580 [Sphingomonas bacterium]